MTTACWFLLALVLLLLEMVTARPRLRSDSVWRSETLRASAAEMRDTTKVSGIILDNRSGSSANTNTTTTPAHPCNTITYEDNHNVTAPCNSTAIFNNISSQHRGRGDEDLTLPAKVPQALPVQADNEVPATSNTGSHTARASEDVSLSEVSHAMTSNMTGSAKTPGTVMSNMTGSAKTPGTVTSDMTGSAKTPGTVTSNMTGSAKTPETVTSNMTGSAKTPGTVTLNMTGSAKTPGTVTSDMTGSASTPGTVTSNMTGSAKTPGTVTSNMTGSAKTPGTVTSNMTGSTSTPGTVTSNMTRSIKTLGTNSTPEMNESVSITSKDTSTTTSSTISPQINDVQTTRLNEERDLTKTTKKTVTPPISSKQINTNKATNSSTKQALVTYSPVNASKLIPDEVTMNLTQPIIRNPRQTTELLTFSTSSEVTAFNAASYSAKISGEISQREGDDERNAHEESRNRATPKPGHVSSPKVDELIPANSAGHSSELPETEFPSETSQMRSTINAGGKPSPQTPAVRSSTDGRSAIVANVTTNSTHTLENVSTPLVSEQDIITITTTTMARTSTQLGLPGTVSAPAFGEPITTDASIRNDTNQRRANCPSPEVGQRGDAAGSNLGLVVGLPVAGALAVAGCLVLACRLRKQLNRDESVFYTSLRLPGSCRRRQRYDLVSSSSASPGLSRRECSRC